MSLNFNDRKQDLFFIPLGGAAEIGMNLNLYHLEGKWLIVDMGAGFADDYVPGVDLLVPDINFIIKNELDIAGLVLTHIHEDHLGAVQYIWQEIGCPIYATPLAGAFLKHKVTESGQDADSMPINIVACDSQFNLGPFTIELTSLTHSTPEMQALLIKTKYGNIFHTGDWKFDNDPVIGDVTDKEKLKKYGKDGVLAFVGDSTNVFNLEPSGSEGALKDSLSRLIADMKNMVVITTFASNVARLKSILMIAKAHGRQVIVSGRSIWRVISAAKGLGYLDDVPSPLDESHFNAIPRDKILLLCTGCQGEPLAAIAKMASNNHPRIKIRGGDNIIFSSKIIPGNEKRIFRLFNIFIEQDIEVFTEKDHFVHVSGHPGVTEMKEMYELLKPKIAVPVHGELVHMHEHARLAKEWGVTYAMQVKNGKVLKLAPNDPEIIGEVESGYLAVDGHSLISVNHPVIRMRRKIQKDGIIIATLLLGKNGRLQGLPIINAPGCFDAEEDRDIIEAMESEVVDMINSRAKSRRDLMENATRTAIKKVIRECSGKNPPIVVNMRKLVK